MTWCARCARTDGLCSVRSRAFSVVSGTLTPLSVVFLAVRPSACLSPSPTLRIFLEIANALVVCVAGFSRHLLVDVVAAAAAAAGCAAADADAAVAIAARCLLAMSSAVDECEIKVIKETFKDLCHLNGGSMRIDKETFLQYLPLPGLLGGEKWWHSASATATPAPLSVQPRFFFYARGRLRGRRFFVLIPSAVIGSCCLWWPISVGRSDVSSFLPFMILFEVVVATWIYASYVHKHRTFPDSP